MKCWQQLLNQETTHRHESNACIEKKHFIQYVQTYRSVCVYMEEKESMDVNYTYMTLNTENNVHIDGKYHKNRDSKKNIGTQTMIK